VPVDLARDPVAIEELNNNYDVHERNREAFGLPSRLIAKIYLFRTIFRGSGWSFANDPEFRHVSDDPGYWDAVNEKFFRKYHGIDLLHQRWANDVILGKPLIGPTGRQWFIEMGTDRNGNPKLPMTKLTNYPVQGTAADIMMVARISFFNRLKKVGLTGRLVSSVHDSLVVDAPEKEVESIAMMLYETFNDIPKNFKKLFNYEMAVQYPCEVKAGPNLFDMTAIDKTY
jgi:DNA polymerase I-like protein with 3'-5' exonuclease and polymerase domains